MENQNNGNEIYQQMKQIEAEKNAAKSNLSISLLGIVTLGLSAISVGLSLISSIVCCTVGLYSVIKNKPKRAWAIAGMIIAGATFYLNIFYA